MPASPSALGQLMKAGKPIEFNIAPTGDLQIMARTRQFEVKDGRAYVKTQMKDGQKPDGTDNMVAIEYDVPATPADFRAYVMSLPDAILGEDGEYSGELADVHQAYWSGFDMKLRADKRESSAAESTVIKVDKNSIDLMELPLNKAVLAINGVYAVAQATGKEAQKAYEVARRKLLEAGKVEEVDMGGTTMLKVKAA